MIWWLFILTLKFDIMIVHICLTYIVFFWKKSWLFSTMAHPTHQAWRAEMQVRVEEHEVSSQAAEENQTAFHFHLHDHHWRLGPWGHQKNWIPKWRLENPWDYQAHQVPRTSAQCHRHPCWCPRARNPGWSSLLQQSSSSHGTSTQ